MQIRHFNSIKVRLERNQIFSSIFHPRFQFHKGAIRTHLLRSAARFRLHFNSIKVRLERFNIALESCQALFQFHKGAIRTCWGDVDKDELFHFNSIKVRLERHQQSEIAALKKNFNSIKVRLEPPLLRPPFRTP